MQPNNDSVVIRLKFWDRGVFPDYVTEHKMLTVETRIFVRVSYELFIRYWRELRPHSPTYPQDCVTFRQRNNICHEIKNKVLPLSFKLSSLKVA